MVTSNTDKGRGELASAFPTGINRRNPLRKLGFVYQKAS